MLMNKIAYPKEQKSFDEQIALLKQRGMYFEDEVRANCILQYYRLSGYWYPLLKDKQRHIFKDGLLLIMLIPYISLIRHCVSWFFLK